LRGDDRRAGDHAAHQDRAVEARGAKVVLFGDSYSDAYAHALALAEALARRCSCIPTTIRTSSPDKGTIGMEILRQHRAARRDIRRHRRRRARERDCGVREARFARRVQVIGVQPEDSDAMARSIEAGGASSSRTWACSPTAWR
jgi:threonine dehydratase